MPGNLSRETDGLLQAFAAPDDLICPLEDSDLLAEALHLTLQPFPLDRLAHDSRIGMELVESRTFDCGVVFLNYQRTDSESR